MVSINTLTTNRAVLSNLRQINSDIETSQNRISSGYKVNSAKDNASVWATAQSIRSDMKVQDNVQGYVAIGKGQADAASAALTKIQTILTNIQSAAANLVDTGAATAANNVQIGNDIKNYMNQLLALAKGASFQGANFLTSANSTVVSTTISQDQGSPVSLDFSTTQVLSANGSTGTLAAIFGTTQFTAASTANGSTGTIDVFKAALTTAITTVNAYTASVGNYASSLGSQQDFLDTMKGIRSTALGSLVDADLEEESAKVTSLQVKQQLAYQALAITNSSAQNILALFR